MSNELLFRKNYKYIIQKTVYDSPETGTSFYCALEEETGRKVGIKVIKAKNTNALRSFITEVNVLTRLESKVSNVPTVYYHYCVGNTLYIVMQYIEGETLRQKMDTETSPLDSPEAVQRELSRLRLLASTLRDVHKSSRASGRIYTQHKDLKPQNIIIKGNTPFEKLYLIDFGISAPGAVRGSGTPFYQSPEQSALFSGVADGSRIDVFAFGLMMYELLCRKRLIMGSDLVYDSQKGDWKNIPLISEMNPHVPKQVDEIFKSCLAYNPAKRIADGGAIECLLRKIPRKK